MILSDIVQFFFDSLDFDFISLDIWTKRKSYIFEKILLQSVLQNFSNFNQFFINYFVYLLFEIRETLSFFWAIRFKQAQFALIRLVWFFLF